MNEEIDQSRVCRLANNDLNSIITVTVMKSLIKKKVLVMLKRLYEQVCYMHIRRKYTQIPADLFSYEGRGHKKVLKYSSTLLESARRLIKM